MLITTCHSYNVHKPFKFVCTNIRCKLEYNRHSKKGIDVDRHRCGKCRSKIEFQGQFEADGLTPKKVRAASGFSLFVQNHFKKVKNMPSKLGGQRTHKEIMQELSRMYHSEKLNKSTAEEKEGKEVIDLVGDMNALGL